MNHRTPNRTHASGLAAALLSSVLTAQAQITSSNVSTAIVYVGEETTLDISGRFQESNSNPLTYSATELPVGLQINQAGLITGTLPNANEFYLTVLSADNGLGDSRSLPMQLRVLPRTALRLPGDLPSDFLLRCDSAEVTTTESIERSVDFSSAGICVGTTRDECSIAPAGSRIINASLDIQVEHPSVDELSLSLISPHGAVIELFQPQSGSCSRGDVAATFSDNAPWPASSRCNEQESAIAGPLAPASPMSALRNQSPIGGPWTLRLDNSGSTPATLVNWCLALQLSEPGDIVFPQADLPGSAQLVDFQGGESAVLSGNLTRDDQVDWYLVEQSFPCRLEVSISTNDGSPAPRLFRQPSLSPFGSEPLAFPSACQDDRVSSSTGAVFVPNGREYVRVQRCPDADSTAYELNFQLDTSFCRPPPLDSNGGVISGSIIGANLQPVAAAYVQGGDGTGYFSNLAGDFTGLYTAGTYPLQIFHPEFETLTTAPVTVVPRGSETVGTVTLTPTQYQDSLNDRLFDSGFEFSEGN